MLMSAERNGVSGLGPMVKLLKGRNSNERCVGACQGARHGHRGYVAIALVRRVQIVPKRQITCDPPRPPEGMRDALKGTAPFAAVSERHISGIT